MESHIFTSTLRDGNMPTLYMVIYLQKRLMLYRWANIPVGHETQIAHFQHEHRLFSRLRKFKYFLQYYLLVFFL